MTPKSSTPKSNATARPPSTSTRSSKRSSKASGARSDASALERASAGGFRPTALQLAYAVKFCEAIAQGQPSFDTVIAPQVPTERSVIARWRMNDAFCDWLDGFTERMFRKGMTKLLLRAFGLGLKGSVKHMEFFARYSGQIASEDLPAPMGGSAAAGPAFVVVVPRPPGAVPESAILVGSGRA